MSDSNAIEGNDNEVDISATQVADGADGFSDEVCSTTMQENPRRRGLLLWQLQMGHPLGLL